MATNQKQKTIKASSKGKYFVDGVPVERPLIGDRIASMTKAVGIKPCGGCKKRQQWLNEKHQQLRDKLTKVSEV